MGVTKVCNVSGLATDSAAPSSHCCCLMHLTVCSDLCLTCFSLVCVLQLLTGHQAARCESRASHSAADMCLVPCRPERCICRPWCFNLLDSAGSNCCNFVTLCDLALLCTGDGKTFPQKGQKVKVHYTGESAGPEGLTFGGLLGARAHKAYASGLQQHAVCCQGRRIRSAMVIPISVGQT